MKRIYIVFFAIVLTGCSSGFDRGIIQERLAGSKVETTDGDIQKALETKPQLRFPIKIAVYLAAISIGEPNRSGNRNNEAATNWRWDVKDKEKIESWANELKGKGVVSDIFVLSDLTLNGDDTKSIRLAAAKHGADAVLIIKGISQVDRYVNPLCILNLAIIPMWFVPASHRDTLMILKGIMMDVGNEYLYLTVESEGMGQKIGTTHSCKDLETESIEQAKQGALNDFGLGFVKRVTSLKGN